MENNSIKEISDAAVNAVKAGLSHEEALKVFEKSWRMAKIANRPPRTAEQKATSAAKAAETRAKNEKIGEELGKWARSWTAAQEQLKSVLAPDAWEKANEEFLENWGGYSAKSWDTILTNMGYTKAGLKRLGVTDIDAIWQK